jgi:hypothetical protein
MFRFRFYHVLIFISFFVSRRHILADRSLVEAVMLMIYSFCLILLSYLSINVSVPPGSSLLRIISTNPSKVITLILPLATFV